jgi:FkbM family methyltransferase
MKSYLRTIAGRLRLNKAGRPRRFASMMEVERAEQMFYLAYLREGMIVFDVGANVGELTLLFSRFVGAGQVHAFEASGRVFERLKTVSRASGCTNVFLNHLAVAEAEGTVRLHVYDERHLGWNTLAVRPLENYGIDVKPVAAEEVRATTIDLYCEREGINKIDLLKIDVEGAEFQVLRGARRMLREKRIACVTFEFGQTTFDMGNNPDEIEAYLTNLGYKLRNMVLGQPIFPGRETAHTACFSMHIATLSTGVSKF